ncbi:MAG TPA: hypothetical protein PKY78_09095 [Candidatus Omnitrophota bacterium]|nr:hypothetical protein [Candidatus Omnitrophota bacterium]
MEWIRFPGEFYDYFGKAWNVSNKAAEDCLSFNETHVLIKNGCLVKASSAGAKIVRKFSE